MKDHFRLIVRFLGYLPPIRGCNPTPSPLYWVSQTIIQWGYKHGIPGVEGRKVLPDEQESPRQATPFLYSLIVLFYPTTSQAKPAIIHQDFGRRGESLWE
ncbi:hypothetical protein N7475_005072 [Penicillium sp. IBT 31633x]|nr:hypothetical protein N7475_005072 [Penicillium sp. IBT 31633x]